MGEREEAPAAAGGERTEAPGEPASSGEPATPDEVRAVVGRRGYDEAEDEEVTEGEEH